jgi:hypothetical protein
MLSMVYFRIMIFPAICRTREWKLKVKNYNFSLLCYRDMKLCSCQRDKREQSGSRSRSRRRRRRMEKLNNEVLHSYYTSTNIIHIIK